MMDPKSLLKNLFIIITSLLTLTLYAGIQRIYALQMEIKQESEVRNEKREVRPLEKASLEEEKEAAKEVARLIEMIKLPSFHRKLTDKEIIDKIIELGYPAVPALISEMEKVDRSTMIAAMYSLGRIGDKRAIIPLYKLLPSIEEEQKSKGTNLKELICIALSLLGDVNSIQLIMDGPYAANKNIGFGAATNIENIAAFLGEEAIDPLINVINAYKYDKKVYGAVKALGIVASERAIPFLKKLLNHPDDNVKRLAIEALAQIGNPSCSELIKPFMDSNADGLREAAAESMHYLRDPSAIQKLINLSAKDPVSFVRSKSLLSLGIYHDEKSFQALLKGAHDPDIFVRMTSIKWIGKSGNTMGAETLREKIKEEDARISTTAIEALVELLKDDAEHDLINIFKKDSRWIIQEEALKNLYQLRSTKAIIPVLSILKQAIEEKKKDRHFNYFTMQTLLSYLSELGDDETLESLIKLRSKIEEPSIREIFDGAINDLTLMVRNGRNAAKWIETLQKGDLGDQAVAIEMLGELADPSSVKHLINHFGRVDVEVGSLIPKALGKIKDASARSFLEDLLVKDLYEKRTIYPVRVYAAWALGEIGNPSSIKALKEVIYKYNGEPFSAIVSIAKLAGKEAIPDLYEIKKLILRERSKDRMVHYNNVNWLIRNLKNGWNISALDKEP